LARVVGSARASEIACLPLERPDETEMAFLNQCAVLAYEVSSPAQSKAKLAEQVMRDWLHPKTKEIHQPAFG
jgi:hypothetical protein